MALERIELIIEKRDFRRTRFFLSEYEVVSISSDKSNNTLSKSAGLWK